MISVIEKEIHLNQTGETMKRIAHNRLSRKKQKFKKTDESRKTLKETDAQIK